MNLNERIEANCERIAKLEATVRDLNRLQERSMSLLQGDIADQASLITELQEMIGRHQIGEVNDARGRLD